MHNAMKSFWLYLLLKAKNLVKKLLLEPIIQQLLKYTSQSVVEEFKVPHLMLLDKTLQKCLKYGLKIMMGKNNMFGKHHGDYLLEVLVQ